MTEDGIEECLEEMKKEAQRLVRLLDDPHPGLWSWMNTVAKTAGNIGRLVGLK